MIVDLWIDPWGYWMDNARTFVVGKKPSERVSDIMELVQEAITEGEKCLKPGIPAREAYHAMMRCFEAADMGTYYPAHGGHGIGLTPHEAPLIIPGSEDVLEVGMVCTLEPGLYVPEEGGVRFEDNYVIRQDGPERISLFRRNLGLA